jgi:hypothetical protein
MDTGYVEIGGVCIGGAGGTGVAKGRRGCAYVLEGSLARSDER